MRILYDASTAVTGSDSPEMRVVRVLRRFDRPLPHSFITKVADLPEDVVASAVSDLAKEEIVEEQPDGYVILRVP